MNTLKDNNLLTDKHFGNFIRSSITDPEYLVQSIGSIIQKGDINCKPAISLVKRLLVTLQFLAMGNFYHSLMYFLKISNFY